MAENSKDEVEGTYEVKTDKASSESDKQQKNEEKKRKLLQIRSASSVYIAKMVSLLIIVTIVIFTASDTSSLQLGALTFSAAIFFDMLVLARDNPVSDIWWIYLAHWIITIIFGIAAAINLLLILLQPNISPDKWIAMLPAINETVMICMYIMGIVGPIIEIYYNIPYDD